VSYPALRDGASQFIDVLTRGIPRVFHPASQRRFHPRASHLCPTGKAPPSISRLQKPHPCRTWSCARDTWSELPVRQVQLKRPSLLRLSPNQGLLPLLPDLGILL